MMRIEQLIKLSKTTFSACLVAGVLSAGMAQAGVSQAPLNLVEGVSPNVILTLDESGSMSWGYTPDNIVSVGQSRRILSNTFNSQYYNPNVAYTIPPAFDSSGAEYQLSTSFSNAYHNGFQPDGKIILTKQECNWRECYRVDTGVVLNSGLNLTNGYRVTQEHRIPDPRGTFTQLANPTIDFYANKSQAKVYTSSGDVELDNGFLIKYNNNSCDVYLNGYKYNASCTYKKNNSRLEYSYDLRNTAVPAYYYIYNSKKNSSCTVDDENCYSVKFVTDSSGTGPVGKDERENFAIWFSFYKTRALATLSAASIAFYDLSSNVRFSWQDLATCRSFDGSDEVHCKKNGLQSYSEKHRGQFYSWLRDVYFNVGTPLPAAMIRAGEFYKSDMPWRMYPQDPAVGEKNTRNTTENTLACRPSYHVLMTDGMWNTRQTYTHTKTRNGWSGGYDGNEVAYPTSNTDDNMSAPYGDATKKTLADIAMHYWKTDLRNGLSNKVPPFMPYKSAGEDDPRNNPAKWQHMSNFIMGLGLTNSLNDPNISWEGQTHTGEGYKRLVSGTASWPKAGLPKDRDGEINGNALEANVYDLWHAAINSRGEFYSVDSPEDMVNAFKDIMNRIAERQSTATLPAIASSVEEADPNNPESVAKLASYFYRSSFDSKDWSGDLEKIKSYISYEGNKRTEVTETVWKASNRLPLHGARKIYMASSTASNKLKAFNTTNADTALENALNRKPDGGTSDGNWQKRLDFIRGARSEEGGLFRERSSVLGDFLGSQPVYVAGARYLEGFANKIEGNTKYSEFVEQQKSRRAQIYIGGNAGMLHAFDAAMGDEKFAFVPTAVFPHLNRLTDPRYAETHRFFVDGTPEVADVYDGQNWRTILVGTLRAGGQGIFALDITNPDGIKLLWELDQNSAAFIGKVKPGHSFPRPTIARLHNGRWAVVTGNGYDNGDDSGKAALYIIDAITGELTKSLEVQSPGSATHNGLSTPKLADFNGDGVADYAYAGDLHGNLWRFDLLGANAKEDRKKTEGSIYGDKVGNTTGFKVSYGAEPMFTAESSNNRAQTIMAPPSLVRHPNRQSYLIVFGTGKYYEEGDAGGDLSTAQSIYAIWDEKTKAQTTSALSISRADLLEQSFIENVVGKNEVAGVNREARTLSDKKMDWESKKGWVLDLKVGSSLTGEMLVNDMRVVGTTLLFSLLVPNDDPCAHGAGNWLYAINPFTGGRTVRHVFDTRNADPDHSVQVVSGIKFGGPGGVPLHSTPGGLEVYPGEGVNIAEMTGRQTWRVVPEP